MPEQAEHDDCRSAENEPSAHGSQLPCAGSGCTVPAAHAACAVDPVVHMCPASHAVHPYEGAPRAPRLVDAEK